MNAPRGQWSTGFDADQLFCIACRGEMQIGVDQANTPAIANLIRSAGWRLVIGLGWTCENCIRCIYTPDVSVSGTIETIH